MLSADAVQRGRSLFAGREGDEIADAGARAGRRRHRPRRPVQRARSTARARPRRRTPLIEDGRLLTLPLRRAHARAGPGRATTANASRGSYRSPPSVGNHEPVLEPGERDLDALFREAGDGLYVTDVAGLHSGVNPVSGTFSVGASGG